MNYYETLGVSWNASGDEIHSAYRRLARQYHPDIAGSGSAEKFREVQQAYETLGQSSRRQAYDLSLRPASRPVHITIIPSRGSFSQAEPLVPSRSFGAASFSGFDQIFDEVLRWLEGDWFVNLPRSKR
jgi:DnaJ-class molecular chaperone